MPDISVADVATRHGLNDQQKAFVMGVVAAALSPNEAAAKAGYNSANAVSYLLTVPRVRDALHEAVSVAIRAEAPLNIAVLRRIRDDEKAAAGVRADIALKLLRLAGHVELKTGDDGPSKQLSEMSADELRAWCERNAQEIDRLEAELATRAIDVSAPAGAPEAPIAAAKPKQYLD